MTEPTPDQVAHMRDSFSSFVRYGSLATLIIAPTIILLPPRKLDFYTFTLAGAFCVSATHLYKERRLKRQREGGGLGHGDWALPAKSQQVQNQLQRERERRLLEQPQGQTEGKKGGSLLEEKVKEVWMGGEKEGWKERRLQEERERLAKGEGYGDLIVDQIWEVWNWGEKKGEKLKAEDEEVLRKRRRDQEFPRIGKE